MQASAIMTHARQLFDQMGPKAIAVAAQRAQACDDKGEMDAAQSWRKIEDALKEMRGPHQG